MSRQRAESPHSIDFCAALTEKPTEAQVFAKDVSQARRLMSNALQLIESEARLGTGAPRTPLAADGAALDAIDSLLSDSSER